MEFGQVKAWKREREKREKESWTVAAGLQSRRRSKEESRKRA